MKMLADVGSEGFWAKRANLGGWDAWGGDESCALGLCLVARRGREGAFGEGYPPKTALFVQHRWF